MADLDFDDWYRAERPRVVDAVTAITGRPSIAPDCADEAFTRAFERWDRVAAMDSPGGWVHATALNEARRRLRRSSQERRLLRRVAVTQPVEAPPPTWPIEVWDALRTLSDREREAMVLRHLVDLPVADVARAMGIAEGTVGAHLHRARARLAASADRVAPQDAEAGAGADPR